jgi:DNA-binding YbaB/EbfC family protein
MDIGNMMKTAQGMQAKMAAVQASLKEKVVDGSAGDGMVVAYVNGDMELLKIEIDPKMVDPDDVEMLEDLVLASVNKAMTEMKQISEAEMSKVTGGMNIPGMF